SRAKDNTTSGFNIVSVIMTAFFAHAFFCIFFIAVIQILDITYIEEANFFSGKIFKIFWADGEAQVFALAGASKTMDALGAYASLHLAQTVTKLLLVCIPILVLVGSMAYGVYQGTKDTYKQDYLGVITFMIVSIIISSIIYIAWAYIASEALFLPDGKNLFNMISEFWQKQLLN
ncbi:hypothetical protein KDE13_09210, partial [Campylobacter sp. faydin G-140]|uniref:hypothetical protein n=1 Tax=Campylobacter anatolicus TaxID=2829105 RepID=UPI001B90E561